MCSLGSRPQHHSSFASRQDRYLQLLSRVRCHGDRCAAEPLAAPHVMHAQTQFDVTRTTGEGVLGPSQSVRGGGSTGLTTQTSGDGFSW